MMTKRHRPVRAITTVTHTSIRMDASSLFVTCRGRHGVRPPLEDEVITILEPEQMRTSGDAQNRKASNPGVEAKIEDSVTVVVAPNGTALMIRTTKRVGVPDTSEKTDQSRIIGHINCRELRMINGEPNR